MVELHPTTEPKTIISITNDPLPMAEIIDSVMDPSCGAVSTFIGTTRDHFNGRKVKTLHYTAYDTMALSILSKITTAARTLWPSLHHIAIHHRLGEVRILESSVIIAVSSPHRGESLEAVEYLIDELKALVPIWKKEVYEDGEEGEEEGVWKANSECCGRGKKRERNWRSSHHGDGDIGGINEEAKSMNEGCGSAHQH